ncbi:hypothetical protein, partial [Salmonella enterica]|uniref:hypothetical protein n=1 Tax=Salmonella enterica TaxID=28901 RepID=UPI002EA9889F|nr:hypothetical protein [Salmonella enterica subsp. enterica serovar Paratyphi A]
LAAASPHGPLVTMTVRRRQLTAHECGTVPHPAADVVHGTLILAAASPHGPLVTMTVRRRQLTAHECGTVPHPAA